MPYHYIAEIWEQVRDDVTNRRVIDVDAYCSRFRAQRPDLGEKDIQDIVLDAVGSYGGVATWGAKKDGGGTGTP